MGRETHYTETVDRPWRRLALNTGVSAAGLAFGGLAAYSYAVAKSSKREAEDFLGAHPESTDAYYEMVELNVLPPQRTSMITGILALGCLGGGVALWVTTDLQMTAAPNGLALHRTW